MSEQKRDEPQHIGHKGAPLIEQMTMKEVQEAFSVLSCGETDEFPIAQFRDSWLPAFIPLYWQQLRNLPISEDEISIASFPKSGTHWVHYIAYLVHTCELDNPKPSTNRMLLDIPRPSLLSTLGQFAKLPQPRFLYTHLPAHLLPKEIFNGKVIYIYRNAKDACVSYYYFMKAMGDGLWKFDVTFEQWARRFMSGKFVFGPYPEQVKGYHELKKQGKKILILRYEDMKKDRKAAIRQIAEFLGKQLDDVTIDRIYDLTSFEKMQGNSEVNWDDAKQVGMFKKDMSFIRKGQVGDWRNHFTDPQLLADFDKFISDNLPEELIIPSA